MRSLTAVMQQNRDSALPGLRATEAQEAPMSQQDSRNDSSRMTSCALAMA